MATDDVKAGDTVEWNTSQGTTRGTVKHKLTSPTKIKEHEVKASTEEPQYLVESESTHYVTTNGMGGCSCKASAFGGVTCSHKLATELFRSYGRGDAA